MVKAVAGFAMVGRIFLPSKALISVLLPLLNSPSTMTRNVSRSNAAPLMPSIDGASAASPRAVSASTAICCSAA